MKRKPVDNKNGSKSTVGSAIVVYTAVVSTITMVLAIASMLLSVRKIQQSEDSQRVLEETGNLQKEQTTQENEGEEQPSFSEIARSGEEYAGVFKEELADLNITLSEVEDVEGIIGISYDGNVYTFESGKYDCGDIEGLFCIGDETISVKDIGMFGILTNEGFEAEESEDGNAVSLSLHENGGEDNSELCVVSVRKASAYNSEGEERPVYVGYVYFESADVSGISVDGIGVASSIGDVFERFGVPVYVDVYERSGVPSYLVLYYSDLNEETETMDEMSLVFLEKETGYFLSEITVSVF